MPRASAQPIRDVGRHLEKADDDISALFDRVAPRYDLLNHLLSFNMDVAWRRQLVAAAEVGDKGQVLDCATGTGDVLFEFLRQLPYSVNAVGLDFSPAMLERAIAKAEALGYTDRSTFVHGNLLDLPFEDDAFEAVSIAFGIRNVSSVEGALEEMVRVCRPGGRVLILEFMRQPPSLRRAFSDFYCQQVMPLIARLVARDGGAYRYLAASVRQFRSPVEMVELMGAAGLRECSAQDLFLGIATLHIGTKPDMEHLHDDGISLSEELMG